MNMPLPSFAPKVMNATGYFMFVAYGLDATRLDMTVRYKCNGNQKLLQYVNKTWHETNNLPKLGEECISGFNPKAGMTQFAIVNA
jgi:hypothetical protein